MNFVKWLQARLNAHGARIDEDGDWGRNSIAAMKAFQAARGLRLTGTSTSETVTALKLAPAETTGTHSVPPIEAMPPWMAELHRRMGLHETRNSKSLIEFLMLGKYLGNPAKLPWCGDAIESAMAKTLPDEPLPSNPFWAQAWAAFGIKVPAIVGAIGVIRWSASSGHVGTVAGVNGSKIILLGGNQSNAIKLSSFDRSKFIGFRWPETYPIKQYPALQGIAPSVGSLGDTR